MSDEENVVVESASQGARSVNFTPVLRGYSGQEPLKYWCQKVLPLSYDDSLSYYELLCKVIDYLNHANEDIVALQEEVSELRELIGGQNGR